MSELALQGLIRSIKELSERPERDNLIYGEVTSVDPLKIDIGNNITLTEEFLFLGQMCRPYKVTIPHTHQYNGKTEKSSATGIATDPTLKNKGDLSFSGSGSLIEVSGHLHDIKEQVTEDVHKKGTDYEEYVTIEIEPKLRKGDIVLIFAFNNFQKFYVAERIEQK